MCWKFKVTHTSHRMVNSKAINLSNQVQICLYHSLCCTDVCVAHATVMFISGWHVANVFCMQCPNYTVTMRYSWKPLNSGFSEPDCCVLCPCLSPLKPKHPPTSNLVSSVVLIYGNVYYKHDTCIMHFSFLKNFPSFSQSTSYDFCAIYTISPKTDHQLHCMFWRWIKIYNRSICSGVT